MNIKMGKRGMDFKSKEVINITDGRRLGFVQDVCADLETGKITSIIVPGANKLLSMFTNENDIVITWDKIKCIGDDIILVEVQWKVQKLGYTKAFQERSWFWKIYTYNFRQKNKKNSEKVLTLKYVYGNIKKYQVTDEKIYKIINELVRWLLHLWKKLKLLVYYFALFSI